MLWTSDSPEVRRNAGFMSAREQDAVLQSQVAIAGVGGEGFNLALLLARSGVQRFRIADPEVFEAENVNRVPGARTTTLQKNKAEVLRHDILDINPSALVEVWPDGIGRDSADDFVEGASLTFDGIDLFRPDLSVALYRAARRHTIPAMTSMNIGRSAVVTSFKATGGTTFEKLIGISDNLPLDQIKPESIPLSRTVPYLPSYENVSVLQRVASGQMPLPSLAVGVGLATALAAEQALRHLTHYEFKQPVWARRFAYVDIGDTAVRAGTLWSPRASHYRRLLTAVLRSVVGAAHQPGGYGDMP